MNGLKSYKKKNGKLGVKLMFDGKDGKTKQEFKEECQIQNIINKYHKTGMITHLAKHQGDYGDFSNITSYQDAVMAVIEAEETFNELPANIRNKFKNNPAELLDFLADDKNYDEAIKLGLIAEQKVEQTKPAGAVSQETSSETKESTQSSEGAVKKTTI